MAKIAQRVQPKRNKSKICLKEVFHSSQEAKTKKVSKKRKLKFEDQFFLLKNAESALTTEEVINWHSQNDVQESKRTEPDFFQMDIFKIETVS